MCSGKTQFSLMIFWSEWNCWLHKTANDTSTHTHRPPVWWYDQRWRGKKSVVAILPRRKIAIWIKTYFFCWVTFFPLALFGQSTEKGTISSHKMRHIGIVANKRLYFTPNSSNQRHSNRTTQFTLYNYTVNLVMFVYGPKNNICNHKILFLLNFQQLSNCFGCYSVRMYAKFWS